VLFEKFSILKKEAFMKKITLFFVAFFLFSYYQIRAQDHTAAGKHMDSTHIMYNAMDLKWGDGPPALPKGVQMVVLEGDPSKEGMVYPQGYDACQL